MLDLKSKNIRFKKCETGWVCYFTEPYREQLLGKVVKHNNEWGFKTKAKFIWNISQLRYLTDFVDTINTVNNTKILDKG